MNRRSRFCRPMPYHLAMSPRKFVLERETGFEPATSTLARLHSTTELLPRGVKMYIGDSLQTVNRKNEREKEIFLRASESPSGRKKTGAGMPRSAWLRQDDLIRFCFPYAFQLQARRPASFPLLRAGRGGAPCPRGSWEARHGIRTRGAPCRTPAFRGRIWQVRQC